MNSTRCFFTALTLIKVIYIHKAIFKTYNSIFKSSSIAFSLRVRA